MVEDSCRHPAMTLEDAIDFRDHQPTDVLHLAPLLSPLVTT